MAAAWDRLRAALVSLAPLYTPLVCFWLGLSVVVFLVLLFVAAPYGRHNRGGWGPSIGVRLGWVLMEAPAPLVFLLCFAAGGALGGAFGGDLGHGFGNLPAIVLLCLWETHYILRAFVYPMRQRPGRERSMPFFIVASGFCFNLVNGFLNGGTLGGAFPSAPAGAACPRLTDPHFLLGVLLFGIGFAVNQHADAVLLRLRDRPPAPSGPQPQELGTSPGPPAGQTRGHYRIPHGGLYRFVSCPNYLGEIVEWSGFALASWSLAGLAFAVWTAANLVPRALAHHRWYRRELPDYPPGRRALIPFVL